MPGAKPRRGRGRGGARGGVAATSETQSPNEQSSTIPQDPISTPLNDASTSNSVIDRDLSQPQVSPNSSPASAPTETPAPTPARPPTQRLDSILPGPSINTRGTISRGKFKPRAVRRDKDEREKAEQEELARINAREVELRAQGVGIAPAASRGGFARGLARGLGRGRGRGRGDAMGRGRLLASGLFGIAPAAPDKRLVPGAMNSSATKSGTQYTGGDSGTSKSKDLGSKTRTSTTITKVKQEPGHDGSSFVDVDMDMGSDAKIKAEIPEPVYPEEKDGGRPAQRVDIEHINLVSDSDDEVISSHKGKGRAPPSSDKGGLKPVRLHRKEHKERVTTVNTDATQTELVESSGEDNDDFMIVDGGPVTKLTTGGYKRTKGNATDENDLQIKHDPEAMIDLMDVDTELKVQSEQSLGDATDKNHMTKPKSTRRASNKNKKPVLQTEEEKAEYRRHEEDTKVLLDEFRKLQTAPASRTSFGQEDASTDVSSNGRLYLFQFPPILPPLLNPVKVKEENDDIEMLEATALPLGSLPNSTDANPEEAVVIKADPDGPTSTQGISEPFTEAGYIGKLVVRESGKVELNWGGTSLQLGRGAAFDFLTTTMVINDDSGASMGPVMGKFVATPDWDRMFDLS